MPTIETERLRLREWRDDDLDGLAALNADPEVMRYILDGSTRSRAQTASALAKMRDDWQSRGFGLFAVEVRDGGDSATGAFAGRAFTGGASAGATAPGASWKNSA